MKLCYCARPGKLETVYRQIGQIQFCCSEMKSRWGSLVGFGVHGHQETTSREVNLWTQHPQASEAIINGITPIHHCPWCGEVIQNYREK